MDNFGHLLLVLLLSTLIGLSTYRFTAKITAFCVAAILPAFAVFGLSMNLIYFGDFVSYLIILYFLYLVLMRNESFLKLFMASFAAVILAGFSHSADRILIWIRGSIPSMDSPLRPHNLWHSPLFALSLSILATLIIPPVLNLLSQGISRINGSKLSKLEPKIIPLLAATYFGYLTHIFADSITYDFDVWWIFPFSNVHFSLYDLANNGRVLALDQANPWGWVYYWLTPAILIIFGIFVFLSYLIKKNNLPPKH